MGLRNATEMFKKSLRQSEHSAVTVRNYNYFLKKFIDYLEMIYNGTVYPEEITVQDIESFLYGMKEAGLAPKTRNIMLGVIRSFLKYCVKMDLIAKNPAEKLEPIKFTTKERCHLTEEEFRRLIAQATHLVMRTLFITLYNTGLRIAEARNLKIEDVKLDLKVIKVIEGKGKKNRTVPINDTLLGVLKDYIENIRKPQHPSDMFFATPKTGAVSNQYANEYLNVITKKAGLTKKVSCHILRHSFASNLVKKNVNIVSVQKLLGHSSLKTTSIYTHVNIDELRMAVNA